MPSDTRAALLLIWCITVASIAVPVIAVGCLLAYASANDVDLAHSSADVVYAGLATLFYLPLQIVLVGVLGTFDLISRGNSPRRVGSAYKTAIGFTPFATLITGIAAYTVGLEYLIAGTPFLPFIVSSVLTLAVYGWLARRD